MVGIVKWIVRKNGVSHLFNNLLERRIWKPSVFWSRPIMECFSGIERILPLKKRILEMSFRWGLLPEGVISCSFDNSRYHMASLWKEQAKNSIALPLLAYPWSFTFFERILPEVVFVVYSSFVPISEKSSTTASDQVLPNGHYLLNGSIPEAVICSNKPTGGARQSSYSSPFNPRKCIERWFLK